MATAYRDTRGNSRAPVSDFGDDSYNDDHTPKAGNKRLFSDRLRLIDKPEQHGYDGGEAEEEEEGRGSGKRHRNSDWPLSNTTNTSPSSNLHTRGGQRNRSTPISPARRPTSSQVRRSRFVEGSVNGTRAIHPPPAAFLGEEEDIRERYEQEEQNRGGNLAIPRKLMLRSESVGGSTADHSEASRHSGIFRFGKSIAATFNPTNWFGRSKPQGEYVETAQQKILRERKEKAEKIYEELKQTGRFRDSDVPPNFQLREEDLTPTRHDSGIAFLQLNDDMSREEKRMGRFFAETPRVSRRGATPSSMISESVSGSARTGGRHFKTPSLSNISKAFGSKAGSVPGSGEHEARRIPSRKDLQHKQKLVKRVSNLETKLEAARRQLADALGEPLPPLHDPFLSQAESFIAAIQPPSIAKPRLTPGGLSTLFSEGNLAGHVPMDESGYSEPENASQIGWAVTADHQVETTIQDALDDSSGTHELEGDTSSASPLKTDNSLPEIPQIPDTLLSEPVLKSEKIMQSVEVKIESENEMTVARPSRPPRQRGVHSTEEDSDVSSSHYTQPTASYKDDGEADDMDVDNEEDMAPVKKAANPKTTARKVTPTKKRKSRSSHERDVDTYKPTKSDLADDSDDSDTKVKRTRALKKAPFRIPATRPHKLQKTTQQTKISPAKEATQPREPFPQPKRQLTPKKPRSSIGPPIYIKKTTSTVSRSSSKVTKPRPSQTPLSPPPANLDYQKPSSRRSSQAAVQGEEDDVPPMPKVPDAVRLPSGEIISTAGKLTKPRPVERTSENERRARNRENRENGLLNQDSFVWDRDTF